MTDFATVADVVAAAQGDAMRRIMRPTNIAGMAGNLMSLWLQAGSAPGAAATPTSATTGALYSNFHAAAGATLRLLGYDYGTSATSQNSLIYDRLGHMSGLDGTSVAAQTVNLSIATPAADGRCLASGDDVEWFLEWYVATGSTAVTATISYTNQSGVSGRTTTVSIAASTLASVMRPINVLAAGDTSIQSIQTVTLSASTLTVGNFGVTAAKRLAQMPRGEARNDAFCGGSCFKGACDPFVLGMPKVHPNACLFEVDFTPSSGGSGFRNGYITIGSK